MKLPILILNPHPRCNCRCAMCDIWKATERAEITAEELLRQTPDFAALGVEWVVLSGGEALMHSDLFSLCRILRQREVRISLLSSGLLLERYAADIVRYIDDVIVSLDGPPGVHDDIRGIPGAFAHLVRGVAALRALRPGFSVTARSTVQKRNYPQLRSTVEAARAARLDGISFLGADVSSEAFNRPGGWPEARADSIALSTHDVDSLSAEVERLIAEGECGTYVVESPEKLRGIVRHFRAHLGLTEHTAPRCSAPWVSAVVEANGDVRPCFFHPSYGRLGADGSLEQIVNGPAATAFREQLDVATNETCRRCVCSLYRE